MENSKTILIAEDDKFLASALKVKFEKEGFTVKIAENGDQAEAMVKEQKPSAMLLDLMMPGKDGFAVLEVIKNDASLQGFPIIIASNLGQKEDIEKGLALGATDYIVKSNIPLSEVVSKITSLVK